MKQLFSILALAMLPASAFAQLTAYESGGKWGFRNSEGEIVVPARYAGVGVNGIATSGGKVVDVFTEGFAPVTMTGTATGIMNSVEHGKWGFIDSKGKEIVPLRYDEVSPFHNGYAIVAKDGHKGLVDKAGKEVIPAKYEQVQDGFSEGLAMVSVNGKWGYVNERGQEAIPPKFYAAKPFSEGLAAVAPAQAKQVTSGTFAFSEFGFIDKSGKLLIPAQYGDPFETSNPLPDLQFHNGQARVSVAGKPAFIDRSGAAASPNLINAVNAIYLDSYKGFAKSQGTTVLQRDTASNRSIYGVNNGPSEGKSGILVNGAQKVYVLRYATGSGSAAALAAIKDYMRIAAETGRNFRQYKLDYSADKNGNTVLSMLELKNGLPDPRTMKMRVTESPQGFELLITGAE